MACEAHIIQSRNLKRKALGPPDVYPQLADQKEDRLNDLSLKKGFANPAVTSNECGSARERIKAKGLTTLHQNVLNSSKELGQLRMNLNTIKDNSTRKIQTIQRDNFWSVNPRSNRQPIKKFFTDLSSTNKPLASLVKSRIPSFQKKEEILDLMAEYQVPLMRAMWFMKISAVHMSSISKKRHTYSVPAEWTKAITDYLKDNLSKFAERGQDYGKNTLSTGNKAYTETCAAKNRWNYTLRLCHFMYQDGLLDKQEFLLFLVRWIHELKIPEKEDMLRHLIQVMLTYLDDVVENFVLSRCAAYMCVTKLNSLAEISSERSTFEWDAAVKDCQVPVRSDCPYHDSLLLIFSNVLQQITLLCPTALVYQRHWVSPLSGGEGIILSKESPLDALPCYPASLPFSKSLDPENVSKLRHEISENTEDVRVRSVIAEECWMMGEDTQPPSVIPMLNTLDEHNFYTAQQGGSTGLYKKVFGPGPVTKPLAEQLKDDSPIVAGLCEWAVTHRRTGSHRWLVVAELLKKRQSALLDQGQGKKAKKDEYIFQDILFKYLNEGAPTWTTREEDRQQFSNMVILFGELVRSMFSYLKYLTKLISRGDLPCSKINIGTQQDFTILCKEMHTLPRHIQYVLSLPLPDTHKEELKQRSSLLFGTGIQASLPLDNTHKELRTCLLSLSASNNTPFLTLQRHAGIIEKFKLLPPVYKYMITQRLMDPILPTVPSKLPAAAAPARSYKGAITLPTIYQVELIYLLMELSSDVRSMMTFSMDMMNRFAGLKKLGVAVPLDIYLCITAVLKKYQTCLLISEKDTEFVFDALSRLTDEECEMNAAERCILIYRQELHKASPKLSNNREEPTSTKYSSSKKQRLKTVPNVLNPQSAVFKEDVENPTQADISAISQKIAKNEALGQSFVSTVIVRVCTSGDKHSLPALANLCAELTTRHSYLEGLWIAGINQPHHCGEIPEGTEWWSMLTIFLILLLRCQCFSLWWLMYYVIYPNLYNYSKFQWPTSYHIVYLMVALFTQVEYPDAENLDEAIITHSAFRHLDADRRALKPLRFATMLKLLIRNSSVQQEIPVSHKYLQPMAVLKSICSQVWVPELCLSNPEKLVDNYLVDKEITPHNAQLLLHMICNPQSHDVPSEDPSLLIAHILKSMDKWTMISSQLKVRLVRVLSRENKEGDEESATLKLITDAVVDTLGNILADVAKGDCKNSTLWLLPTFIVKLHDQVKERLIEWLGEWLGEGSWWENEFTFCESTTWHQPLIALMTGCPKTHVILPYLMQQLKRFIDEMKDMDSRTEKQIEQINVALHFRISLVGAHFHHITSNPNMKTDWGILLLRLVRHPAVDSTQLGEGVLFFSILDMLATIVEPLEVACHNAEEATARTMFFKEICNDIQDVDNPVNMQVRQLLKIPLFKQDITIVEHTSVNEEWSSRQPGHYENIYPELKPEGYVPVGKRSISPWELVEGGKGGCNVAPWQELGGVRCDKQLLKMEERLCVNLKGHPHEVPAPLQHEQVSIPTAPKPKTEQLVPQQQFITFQARPQLIMAGSKPRMMRPMQQAHFSAIMGAPAPNVTITQQGPVPTFNPHEVPGQYTGFEPGAAPSQFPTTGQQQPIFDNTNFIENQGGGGMVRAPYNPGNHGNRGMRPQFLTEQQKRALFEQRGMVFQQSQGAAQQPPPYLQQPMSNASMGSMDGYPPPAMMGPQQSQFMQPVHMNRPPMSLPVSLQQQGPVSVTGQPPRMLGPPSDPSFNQSSFFDQQFN